MPLPHPPGYHPRRHILCSAFLAARTPGEPLRPILFLGAALALTRLGETHGPGRI